MNNSPVIATNKIIFFVVFVCAALMTSLFIFHLSHKAIVEKLPAEQGMVFPVARDIKEFKLFTADNKKFSEQAFRQHWTLLFFGFTHCSSICPTTLDMLQRAYVKLHGQYPALQIALVSLDPERDTPDALAQYTQSFNKDFIGVTGKLAELRKLQSQLGVYSERDPMPGNNYQLQHTASIMLINPEGKWAGLFKFGLNPEQFTQAFTTAMTLLQAA